VQLSGFMLVGILVIAGFLYAVNVQPIVTGDQNVKYYGIKNFTSYHELTEFITGSFESSYSYAAGWGSVAPRFARAEDVMMLNSKEADGGGEVVDYSQTNVQVAGVDEPDIVKTDGTYLYIVSGNKVIIVKAVPAENATIEAEIMVNESTTIHNIFIDDVRIPSPWYSSPDTYIKLYDMANLQHPELIRDIVVGGSFSGARLIDDYVYVITTQYSYQYLLPEEGEAIVPRIQVNGEVIDVPLSDIYYIDLPEKSSTVTNIVSIDIHDDESEVNTEVFLLGDSHVLYVSRENIYVTYSTRYYDYEMLQDIIDEILMPVLPESITSELEVVNTLTLDDHQKQTVTEWILQNYVESMDEKQLAEISRAILRRVERTVIHRIHIHDGDITYEAQGNVPGGVSNQFSLSEHDDYLRISTTMQGWMVRSFVSSIESQNNIYVLDMDLEIVGSLEGLAPGEQIYATRFIGETCYLVTFRQIDPFFVIDLSDPTDPTVLGELKIPGFSTYLHPYDETHIIGIGREDNKVKISLFDVSDMNNPVEIAKYEIENNDEDWRWMQSSALYEHKAFLFDREKNLLVIPVGDYSKQSAYVFDISVEHRRRAGRYLLLGRLRQLHQTNSLHRRHPLHHFR